MNWGKRLLGLLLNDDFSIQQKLMNIAAAATFVGAFISFVITFFQDIDITGSLTTLAISLFLLLALYFSIVKRREAIAALIAIAFADIFLLVVLYFTSGGLFTGMPLWFLLGLAVPVFILRNNKFIYLSFITATLAFVGCILVEVKYPSVVSRLSIEDTASDIAVSMVLIAFIFGAIFRFQAYVYGKQAAKLKKKDEEMYAMVLELQDTLEKLEKANKAKSNFLANMSHEIRTPINAVLGMDEMILRETKEADVERYAVGIRNSGQALLAVINDILDFSKIESGKLEILPAAYDLYTLMCDCCTMVEMRVKEKNLQFLVTNNPNVPKSLLGDEYRIRQIIVNLLTNAVKYTKTGCIIFSVQFERQDEKNIMLNLSVKDTGKGISEEGIGVLFNSFQRVDEQQNKFIEGTGLGLAITKQLVDLMGGTISVESELGKGSKFVVKIPQAVVANDSLGDFYQQYQNRSVKNERYKEKFQAPNADVLVVDDVRINLDVIGGLLKQTKVRLDFATSGEQALGLIVSKRYDAILLDHMMPGMDGVETLEEIRKMSNGMDVPVIALTANAIAGAADEYLKAGFSDYLSKPVKGDILETCLMKYLPKEKIQITAVEKKSVEESIPAKPLLERLNFIDSATGLLYCANDENLYTDILKSYVENTRLDVVISTYNAQDWDNYRIHVHSLKSSSLTIGATQFSEHARLLELAIINGDFEKVNASHNSFVAEYQELLVNLKKEL